MNAYIAAYLIFGAWILGYCDGGGWIDNRPIVTQLKRFLVFFAWPLFALVGIWLWLKE